MSIVVTDRRATTLLLALLLTACADKGKDTASATDGAQTTAGSETATGDATTTTVSTTDATTAASTTTMPTTSATTDAPVAGCECLAAAPCAVSLCPTVAFDGDSLDTGGNDMDPALEEALACALGALRDGQAGHLAWTYRLNFGQIEQYGSFELFGDGTARRSFGGIEDLCTYLSDDVGVGPLRDAKIYNDCLTEPDLQARFTCVREAVPVVVDTCQVGELDCYGI